MNVFQRPSHRETIRELHRLVIGNDPCNPHAMPRLLSSVQRVSMPVVVETCANYGLYVRLTPKGSWCRLAASARSSSPCMNEHQSLMSFFAGFGTFLRYNCGLCPPLRAARVVCNASLFVQIRRMWGEMWMLWLAPTTATVPESLQVWRKMWIVHSMTCALNRRCHGSTART